MYRYGCTTSPTCLGRRLRLEEFTCRGQDYELQSLSATCTTYCFTGTRQFEKYNFAKPRLLGVEE